MPERLDDADALMLFDGHCNFCSGSARFVLERSRGRSLRFSAMQTGPGQRWLRHLDMPLTDYATLILVDHGEVWLKSEAVLRLAGYMDRPWPWIAALLRPLPRAWRDRLYDLVAANRFEIAGRRAQCFVPEPSERVRFLSDD
jgi:predicted DCC family thiol-disulfide oxidoreductase YuxK